MAKEHSKMVIMVQEPDGHDKDQGLATLEIKGCPNCLATSIAHYLLTDSSFKEIVNKAIKDANAITAARKANQN